MDPQIRRWLIALAIAIVFFCHRHDNVDVAFDLILGCPSFGPTRVRYWG